MRPGTVRTSVQQAAEIAHHVAEYEKAWRTQNSQAMQQHWSILERLCANDTQAQMLRGACALAAAATRDTDCVSSQDRTVEHLQHARERERLIFDYVDGEQTTTTIELAAA